MRTVRDKKSSDVLKNAQAQQIANTSLYYAVRVILSVRQLENDESLIDRIGVTVYVCKAKAYLAYTAEVHKALQLGLLLLPDSAVHD